jgi:hypothetical protein
MKLSEWASIAEIASAAAVVVSLIYVGVEVSQNTAAVKASTQQAMIDYGREQSEILVTDDRLADLVSRGEESPGSLTPHERRQFYEFTTWRLSMWELSFLNHRSGLIDEEMWLAWDGYYRLLVSDRAGYRAFWSDTRPQWDPRFMAHIDASGLSEPTGSE